MSDTFLLLLLFGSLLSLPLFYTSPGTSTLFQPFISTFLALLRCIQVLGVGIAALAFVGGGIFLYEWGAQSVGFGKGKEQGVVHEGRWEDRKRKGKLREGREHGVWPLVILLFGLAASSFVDVGILFPGSSIDDFSASSENGARRKRGGGLADTAFAFVVVGVVMVSALFVRRDYGTWRERRKAMKEAKKRAKEEAAAGGRKGKGRAL